MNESPIVEYGIVGYDGTICLPLYFFTYNMATEQVTPEDVDFNVLQWCLSQCIFDDYDGHWSCGCHYVMLYEDGVPCWQESVMVQSLFDHFHIDDEYIIDWCIRNKLTVADQQAALKGTTHEREQPKHYKDNVVPLFQ